METVIQWVIGICILAEGIRDLLRRQISVVSIVLIAVLGLVLQIRYGSFNPVNVLGGIAVGSVLILIAKLTGEAIGYGDGWMITATGIVLGFRDNFILLCIAFVLCAVVSAILLIFCKAGKKTVLPFVSFLFPAYVLVCMT